jgi:hypothetical protein
MGEKAALRLYCWSFLSRSELRRMALERLRDLTFEADSAGARIGDTRPKEEQ